MRQKLKRVLVFLTLVITSPLLFAARPVNADGNKLAYAFFDGDAETIRVHGIDEDGTNDIQLSGGADASEGQFGIRWSPDGTKIAYVATTDIGTSYDIYVMDADGSNQLALTSDGESGAFGISWSPDSSKISFVKTTGGSLPANLYSINVDGTGETQLTSSGADVCPVWSPTNNKIVFVSLRAGNAEVYTIDTDGSSETNLTNNAATDGVFSSFCSIDVAHDGTKIVFAGDRDGVGTTSDLYTMNIDGTGVTNITNAVGGSRSAIPQFSHDDNTILFGSNMDDLVGSDRVAYQIYTIGTNGTGLNKLTASDGNVILNGGGALAGMDWSPDDSKIAFASSRDDVNQWNVYTMDADGSDQTSIAASLSFNPRWQPVVSSDDNSGGSGSTGDSNRDELAETGISTQVLAMVATALLISGLVGSLRTIRRSSY